MALLGNMSKVALTVALLMGQVTYDSSGPGFIEDDGDFNIVPVHMLSGWGWGLNQAFAECSNEDTQRDGCIEMPDDPFENRPDTGMNYPDSGPNPSDGGISTPTSYSKLLHEVEEMIYLLGLMQTVTDEWLALTKESLECALRATETFEPCLLDRTGTINYLGDWCFVVAGLLGAFNKVAGTVAGGACVVAKDYDLSQVAKYCSNKVHEQMEVCFNI